MPVTDRSDWEVFIANHPQAHLLQTGAWGALKSAFGWKAKPLITRLSEKELAVYRKENISFIFQSYNLIPVLTVIENVELPMVIERRYSRKEMRERASEIVDAVGLGEMADRFPRELSGGQEQRVAIARALVKNPIVVLADEPTANLDSHTAEEIVELMERMNETRNTTFVFSTHDSLVQRHAHRVVTIRDGLIRADEAEVDRRINV